MRIAVLVVGVLVGISAGAGHGGLVLERCVVQHVVAECGTFVVPENRAKPDGRKIALRVVVLPAWRKPVAEDAVTYLAGGPGVAAAEADVSLSQLWETLNAHHDILLVDQRGTGRSGAYSCPKGKNPLGSTAELRAYTRACLKAFGGDMTQYGTRAAMDDLDAVRAALGYRQLDVVGGSYGATAAQVYLKLHPASVRTMTLEGATALDVPFFAHFAVNAQRALDQLARLCSSKPDCRKAFPGWERQFGMLVKAWNAHPAQTSAGVTTTGDELASIVHSMLLDTSRAVSIPLAVSRAAKGDYALLAQQGRGDLSVSPQIMYWSIWCNEPWAGLRATGPWGTTFDGYTAAFVGLIRKGCMFFPKRAEPSSLWTFPSSRRVPALAIEGGADPQDPVTNLPSLKRNFRDSRIVVLPHAGHQFDSGGCAGRIMTSFIERGTTKGLDTSCLNTLATPQFKLGN
jgi:pimeloyl-ACP methyl ester carboxylesterase